MIDWSQAITAETRAAERAQAARDAIRDRRDTAIASGLFFAGVPVGTDDQSQARVMGAAMSAMLDPGYSVAWKTAGGAFVTLTAPQVIALAQAMRAHVQACFDREAALLAELSAGQIYAVDDGWPVQAVRLANGAAVVQRVGTGVYRVATTSTGWLTEAPEGFTVDISQDGEALTVWARRGASLADIPTGEAITLRPTGEA